jgi:Divergent InlB B-repeat domain
MRTSSIAASIAALALAVLRCGVGQAPAPADGGGSVRDGGSGGADGGDGGPAGTPPNVLAIVRSGSGSVRSVPPGIDCGATCSFLFATGLSVALSATPAPGWKFAGWAGACGSTASCEVTLTADTTVWATFEPAVPPPGNHFLSVARAGKGTGRVTSSPPGIDCGSSCGAPFDAGAIVSLSAIPDAGSKFSGWNGSCDGMAGCSVSMASDRSVSASFDLLPPPDDCAELRPADPGPPPQNSLQLFSKSTGVESCRPGFVSGAGTLALPTEDPDPAQGTTLHFVRATGETSTTPGGAHIDLTEQADGFIAQYFAASGRSWLSGFDSSGGLFATTQPPNTSGMLLDPMGGVVALQAGSPSLFLQSYDAQLHLRWSVPLPPSSGSLPPGSGPLRVDRAGNTLVLWDGTPFYGSGSIAAFWVDHGGGQGPVFQLIGPGPGPGATATPIAAERVGSGLFLATGGLWTMQLDSLSTAPTPAPAWLAARPVSEMHMVHAGRGYAVLPPDPGDDGPCAQAIEVIAPSGKSCGSSLFRAADGGHCKPLGIRVGYDGTVVQQLPSAIEQRCGDGITQCTCSWHWWPRFFH